MQFPDFSLMGNGSFRSPYRFMLPEYRQGLALEIPKTLGADWRVAHAESLRTMASATEKNIAMKQDRPAT